MEFALIAPLLILLVFGTVEFGWFFFTKANVANAAREGAREMAISGDAAAAIAKAVNAAGTTSVDPASVGVSPSSCSPGDDVTVTITVSYDALTGWFGNNFPVEGKGVMRCGG